MARKRLPVRKIREILRLRWVRDLKVRATARSLGVSHGVVSQTEQRARHRGLDWTAVEGLDDGALEKLLYGEPKAAGKQNRPRPDPLLLHVELKRKGVTLELLHLEYLEEHPDGYRYTAFCDVYRQWKKRRSLVMRQTHRAGEKMFTDYSGKKPSILDSTTGERIEVELFVAVLGASNCTYVEATATQRVADWLGANMNALEYFGGVPEMTVPDQLKSAVTVSCKYEPGIQKTFEDLGRHYDMAIVPARPKKPKDKAKVEVGVQIAQRWILARLRNERFFTLEALNIRIRELLEELNARPMKAYGGLSRRDLFERVERMALRPLPPERFEPAEWSRDRAGVDYHVKLEGHFYSVPYELAYEEVEIRMTAATVEAFVHGRRVATHVRSDDIGGSTTLREHMPPNHRWWAGKDPKPLIAWGARVGVYTETMMRRIFESNFNREVTFRSASGLRSLADKHEEDAIERACQIALEHGGHSYKAVERILKHGVALCPTDDGEGTDAPAPIDHANVRGAEYYH